MLSRQISTRIFPAIAAGGVLSVAIALSFLPVAAETIHYTDSGSATASEIVRSRHLDYSKGQSHAAMRSVLGTPNEIYQPADRPGYVAETYKLEGVHPYGDPGIEAAHGTFTVEYYAEGDRWVARERGTAWISGGAL